MKSVGSNEPQMTLFSELLFLESCQPQKCEVSHGKELPWGSWESCCCCQMSLLSAQEASVFLLWTKCLFLFSPCSFQILGGFMQFMLAEHLGKAFLKSAKYLLVFA